MTAADDLAHLAAELREEATPGLTFMEVCGTHTMAIARYGLRELLPEGVRLISGPGCPVCVTAMSDLDQVLARGYPGGTDLSGGQWQRVALARALCAVKQGAGLVLLDEPTAQLDVRGEAEIFERVLAATRHCTTILISHRFSTVRYADHIVVLDEGRIVEQGSHEELIALGGRYAHLFNLQARAYR